MNFMVRPSKSFLFDELERRLSKIKKGVGLDAACAGFKNRKMFKTEKYIGLDINLDALRQGVYNLPVAAGAYGLWADLTNLAKLPSNSFAVVVSTNTLYGLPAEKRRAAMEGLCRLVAPDGSFFCDSENDSELAESLKVLKKNFSQLKIIYFKNIISQAYEKLFEKQGDLGWHKIAGLKPFRLLAWLISRLEYLTGNFQFLNKQVFIICQNKIGAAEKNVLDLNRLPLVEKNIYSLMP